MLKLPYHVEKEEKTVENQTLALIASFIGMLLVICSYFTRKKEGFLLFQALCIVFLIISYFFTVQFFAMVGLAVGLLRSLTYFYYEKKEKDAPIWVPLLLAGMTLASYFVINFVILGTSEPLDVLCLIALVGYVFIFRVRNLKLVRFLMPLPTVLSILFNLLTDAAIFATLTYVFELSANVVSILKYHVFTKKHPRKAEEK